MFKIIIVFFIKMKTSKAAFELEEAKETKIKSMIIVRATSAMLEEMLSFENK